MARLNSSTCEIENLEILFFSKCLQENPFLEVPIVADLRLSA
nr:hypothetical protein [Leptolyngbya sp. FACHB-17]